MGAQVTTHQQFGTAAVVFPDGFRLDVATARAESYESPAALPKVVPSSIKDDLSRRDFTINALVIRLTQPQFGEIVDLYGGRRDLKEKTIRVLHALSFVEDPTRVFRAIRFELRFGFHLGKDERVLIKDAIQQDVFHRLSGHRFVSELIRLLCEERPSRVIARLGELELLCFIHRSLKWSLRLDRLLQSVERVLARYRRRHLGRPWSVRLDTWLVSFMALTDVMTARAVGETLRRLKMPERQANKIRAGRVASPGILRRLAKRPPPRPSEIYRVLAGLSEETLLFLMAKTHSMAVTRAISAYLITYRHVKPSLTGTDLKAMGLKPGPIYKKILGCLLDVRLNREISTKAEERELVKQMAKI